MSGERSPGAGEREGDDGDAPCPTVGWELPEIAAVVVLVAVGLVILGGLATGIAAATGAGPVGPGAGAVLTGDSVQLGAEWADPLVAIVLLGVLGACWWQVDRWSDVTDPDAAAEATGHVRRGRQIARWGCGALLLALAGSVAVFAGEILVDSQVGGGPLVWSRAIYDGACVLAVAVIAGGGRWATTRMPADAGR